MKCCKCNQDAPTNLAIFPGNLYTCGKCLQMGKDIKQDLVDRYISGFPGRYVYIAELTNNLDKVQNHLLENIDFNNPFCSVTLVEAGGVAHLNGAFDGVYIDQNCISVEAVGNVALHEHGFIKYVNPTTQELLD